MSVSITVDQTNQVIDEGAGVVSYAVSFEITASEGIPLALFVYSTETQAYEHPATINALESYPDTYEEAVALGIDYYRQASVTRSYTLLTDAINFSNVTRSRLQTIVTALPLAQTSFEGSQTYTLTS